MNKSEIESMLALCYDGIMGKTNRMCIVKDDKRYSMFSLIDGKAILKDFDNIEVHNKQYLEVKKIDDSDYSENMYLLYSMFSHKVWDIPKYSEVRHDNGITLFADYTDNYTIDLAVFLDNTGDLLWRFQTAKPNRFTKRVTVMRQINKYKTLKITIDYLKVWGSYNDSDYMLKAEILFKWHRLNKWLTKITKS